MHTHHLLCLLALLIVEAACDAPLSYNFTLYNSGAYGYAPNQTYRSSNITSPVWQINIWDQEAVNTTDYLFMALPEHWKASGDPLGNSNYGPYIFSNKDFSLVYADPTWDLAKSEGVQEYNDKPYMVFFGGELVDSGHGHGKCYLVNTKYEIEYTISAVGTPQDVDLHECLLTTNGTALIISYYNMPYDLTPLDGPVNGSLTDCLFQEVDIATGELLFEWRAIDHYLISFSTTLYADNNHTGLDWFHMNSVQKTNEGNYLISSLALHMISYIDGHTGSVIWSLGGAGNNFTEPLNDGATILYSHHARFRDAALTELSLFDNTVLTLDVTCMTNCSKGRVVRIDQEKLTVAITEQYFHPQSIQAGPEGSFDLTSNGNVLVGWGYTPSITEHNATTRQCVLDVQFGIFYVGPDNYRAFKAPWKGEPTWDPSIASNPASNGTEGAMVWVSWNGATDVEEWILLSAASPDTDNWNSSQVVSRVSKDGFETGIPVDETVMYARVSGLNSAGQILGSTAIVEIETGLQYVSKGDIEAVDRIDMTEKPWGSSDIKW
ncbi:putative ASST-domain-containing protein [Seiridium unicorne]|uniref:ASST-domain-containing protein n=1 Tax=Seiridium unicorne TaxID=138068 RepID=A0ABR2V8Z0_9PEZI